MKTLNVGLVGCGFIGKVHAYGYLTLPLFYEGLPLRARITHVCASRPKSAERARGQLGADAAVTDFRLITENDAIDVVHICTPNHLHKEALLSAMANGKHIYCDKPLVADETEAEEIADALPAYRGTAQMTLQNRFFPATIRAKQLLASGALGPLLEFRFAYLHAGSANPDAPLKWKLTEEAGGGVIADLASHVLDLAHHLLGELTSLTATTHIAYPDRPSATDPARRVAVTTEDSVMMLVSAAGASGTIVASKIATGVEDELRFEIHGQRGALRFNSMEPHFLEYFDAAAPDQPCGGVHGWTRIATGQRYPSPASAFPGPKFSMGWMRAHAACLANFLHTIAEGRPGDPGLEQGIHIQRLIECVRLSAREGQWVKCPAFRSRNTSRV